MTKAYPSLKETCSGNALNIDLMDIDLMEKWFSYVRNPFLHLAITSPVDLKMPWLLISNTESHIAQNSSESQRRNLDSEYLMVMCAKWGSKNPPANWILVSSINQGRLQHSSFKIQEVQYSLGRWTFSVERNKSLMGWRFCEGCGHQMIWDSPSKRLCVCAYEYIHI